MLHYFILLIIILVNLTNEKEITELDELIKYVFHDKKILDDLEEQVIQEEKHRIELEMLQYTRARSLPDIILKDLNPGIKQRNQRCGIRNFHSIGRFIKEEYTMTAKFGEFPWMLSIFVSSSNFTFYSFKCGGTLLHPMVVLTSASCVYDTKPKNLIILAGDWNMEKEDRYFKKQDRFAIEFELHENFRKDPIDHDIALVHLSHPFMLDDHIQPICLPTFNYNFSNVFCFLTGWGKKFDREQSKESGNFPKIMKKLGVYISSPNGCKDMLGNYTKELGDQFGQTRNLICAGNERSPSNDSKGYENFNSDICEGDEGSPLFCRIPETINIYQLAGIAVWTEGCNRTAVPSIYTNVAKFREWIDNKMKYRGLDQSFYKEKILRSTRLSADGRINVED